MIRLARVAPLASLARHLRELGRCRSGHGLLEFALILPLLTTMGMYGLETAYMHTANMEVSQAALSVADNAARMEQTNNSGVAPTVTESDVNAVLKGGVMESNTLNIANRGKVILSSLEVRPGTTSTQYIHWQRCTGGYSANSAYGAQGVTVTNMGSGTSRVTAGTGTAVMFVEVYYQYNGLFGTLFVQPMRFHQEAAFLIRDDRNLTAGLSGTTTATC